MQIINIHLVREFENKMAAVGDGVQLSKYDHIVMSGYQF